MVLTGLDYLLQMLSGLQLRQRPSSVLEGSVRFAASVSSNRMTEEEGRLNIDVDSKASSSEPQLNGSVKVSGG